MRNGADKGVMSKDFERTEQLVCCYGHKLKTYLYAKAYPP